MEDVRSQSQVTQQTQSTQGKFQDRLDQIKEEFYQLRAIEIANKDLTSGYALSGKMKEPVPLYQLKKQVLKNHYDQLR